MKCNLKYFLGFGFTIYRRKRLASGSGRTLVPITFVNVAKFIEGNRINGSSDSSNITFLEGSNRSVGYCCHLEKIIVVLLVNQTLKTHSYLRRATNRFNSEMKERLSDRILCTVSPSHFRYSFPAAAS